MRRALPALSAAALFLALSLPNLDLPGLHMDEGANGLTAGYVMAAAGAFRPLMMNDWLELGGRVFPLQSEHYVGAVLHYFVMPFVRWLGPTPYAVRLPCVLLSAAGLLCFYRFARDSFGKRAALLAASALATSPAFVQYSRIAFHREEIFSICFLWAALACFSDYAENKRAASIRLGCLSLGLGFAAKITFLWYLVALAAALAATRRLSGLLRNPLLLREGIGFFALGSAFFLIYNLRHGWPSLALLLNSLAAPTAVDGVPKGGVVNLRYLPHLVERTRQSIGLLAGAIGPARDWGVVESWGLRAGGYCLAIAASAALSCVAYQAWRDRESKAGRRLRFLLAFYVVVFLQTPFTVSTLDPGHLLVLLPLPQLALGLCLDRAGAKPAAKALAGAAFAAVLAFNAWTNAHFLSGMRADGGRGRWSAGVYELARFLSESRIDAPVMFGFALRENLAYLTGGRVVPVICREDAPARIAEAFERSATHGRLFVLWAASDDESASRWRQFLEFGERRGRRSRLVKTFVNGAGRPVYWVFELARKAP